MKFLEVVAVATIFTLAFLLWVTILFYGADAAGNLLSKGFSWKDISLFVFMVFNNFFILVSISTIGDSERKKEIRRL